MGRSLFFDLNNGLDGEMVDTIDSKLITSYEVWRFDSSSRQQINLRILKKILNPTPVGPRSGPNLFIQILFARIAQSVE